jgi:hypothetical protein
MHPQRFVASPPRHAVIFRKNESHESRLQALFGNLIRIAHIATASIVKKAQNYNTKHKIIIYIQLAMRYFKSETDAQKSFVCDMF